MSYVDTECTRHFYLTPTAYEIFDVLTLDPAEIAKMIKLLESELPRDVECLLRDAAAREAGLSRTVMETIIKNVEYAKQNCIPMCQDTGTLLFFLEGVFDMREAKKDIEEAIAIATEEAPLRPNTVNPFTRENDGRNLGRGNPLIHFGDGSQSDGFPRIKIIAKGAGSENASRTCMLDPDEGLEGIKRAVVDAVRGAGSKPCPPIFVGVGIGGSHDHSALLAKKALLMDMRERSRDPMVASLEAELLEAINSLCIGPMGFGGKTTALGLRVEWAHCHTASLPVSVCIQCWALRRVSCMLKDGRLIVEGREHA